MIDIIYIGQKGKDSFTVSNHKNLLDRIPNSKIFCFTKPNPNRGHCPYDDTDARGAVQVWDLVDSLGKTPNDIFIKLRTDLWFTNDAIDIIIKELDEIKSGKQTLSFIGWQYKDWDFNQPYSKSSTEGLNHIQDFVIIGNKKFIESKDKIFEKINSRPLRKNISGNKSFCDIIKNRKTAFTVKTHMYLVRKEYQYINEKQLAIDYFDQYAKGKANDYKNWYLTHR